MLELDKSVKTSDKARFKIEVVFGKKRTKNESLGLVHIFESGGCLHGGGDIKIYWCPADDCGKPMILSSKASGQARCEHCGRAWKSAELVGERFFRMSTQKIALLVEKIFHQLDGDVDIFIKYHPTDLKYATLCFKAHDQEVQLHQARVGRQRPYIYTLKRIIQDTAAGATISTRIKAFLDS